ncbi:MAG: alpha/beta hydrolase [Thermoproteota archaeon]|nr:alpha/beta hydrolase [Thermoproteota archaeon]
MKKNNAITITITLIAILLTYFYSVTTPLSVPIYAQQDLQLVKSKNLQIELDDNLTTNAQLTFPAVGQGPYPGILLISGSGANDMNETAGFIRINETTGEKDYPPVTLFQIAQYLSERGFAVLRYDKRGVGENHTILDTNVWGNVTIDDLKHDAGKALDVLMQQPEVNNKITIIGHSEGTTLAPRVAIDNPDKVDNIVLMGTMAQNVTDLLHFQTVELPVQYAEEVLDKNGNGSLSLQEASQDLVFERLIGGNLSVILTQNLPNGTSLLNPEYNLNNDTSINIERELRPALEQNAKSFFASSKPGTGSIEEGKCTNLEGCDAYEKSFFAFEPNLRTIGKVPPSTGVLLLNGENDTQVPVQQALLLQQRLTEVKHPDHTLITYPNLGHDFSPSSQWFTEVGPIPEYVLQDIFSWLSDSARAKGHLME